MKKGTYRLLLIGTALVALPLWLVWGMYEGVRELERRFKEEWK